eukprot:2402320-Rhodomonas_salina.2
MRLRALTIRYAPTSMPPLRVQNRLALRPRYATTVCCYAMSGTDMAYADTRCLVLRWRMLLRDVRY